MKKTIALGVAAATLLAAGVTLAGERGGRHWESLDVDGDGEVTLSEMDAKHREMFDAADSNGDGAISKDEMEAFHKERRAERHAQRFGDADGDGVVSRAEYDAHADARFAKLDKNGDGVLSNDELSEGRTHRRGHGRHGKK